GRNATQINVLTRSGGNQYHGALFEFLRNDVLDARPYSFTTNHAAKSPFKWNQYGYTIGGPVRIPKLFDGRDKLFFMSNYEAFRQRQTSQGSYTVPTAAQFAGDFSGISNVIYDPATRVKNVDGTLTASPFAGNIIPKSRFDTVSSKFLQYYAPANIASRNNNFVRPDAAPINKDQFILRMDYVESARSQWAGRYSWGDENQANQGLTLDGTKVITNFEQYMGSNTRTLTPTIINEARFGYTRFFNSIGTFLATATNVVDTLGIPGLKGGDPVQWGIPNVTLANYSSIGDSTEGPYANNNNSLQFVDNLSIIRGSHTVRFGGEFRRDHYNQIGNQFARGQFTFQPNATQNPANKTGGDSFAEFLLGQLYQSEAAVAVGNAKYLQNSFAIYIDDTWKLTPKLTLALGLRYENTPPYYDTLGNLFSVSLPYFDTTPNVADQSRYPAFIRQGTGTDPYAGIAIRWPAIKVIQDGHLGNRLVARDNNDFAPRIGITYSPNAKWVVRAGGGIFYNQDTGNPRFDMARNIAGRIRTNASLDTPNLLWSDALSSIAGGGVANVTTPYAFANLYNRRTPYTMEYLVNVQRELVKDIVVEVGYLGSISHKLEFLRAVNESVPGATGSVNSRAPYPNFGRIQLVDNSGNANYNAGSVKLTKRYSAGLTLLTSYTYAKSIDNSSGIRVQGQDTLFPQNSNCVRCERGLSAFDTRHRFVSSALYDLPFGKGRRFDLNNSFFNGAVGGWQAGAIWTVQSGFPQTATIGGIDRSGAGGLFDRPNATGINPNSSNPTPSGWFNSAAFVLQPAGTFGNVGRNTLIGPKLFTLDFSAHKEFRIPRLEQHLLQVRFEAFNVMNHPVWGAPNSNTQSVGFGTVTGTAVAMRQLQLALKYVF
ncbi:MAG: TonB-dependent receptor, partial [Bryobacterales bacterium]|nr:TonB-dependent receptor [Bryobacterales bacterium]